MDRNSLADFITAARAAGKSDEDIRGYVAQKMGGGEPRTAPNITGLQFDVGQRQTPGVSGGRDYETSTNPYDLTGTHTYRQMETTDPRLKMAADIGTYGIKAAATTLPYIAAAESGAGLGATLLPRSPILGGMLGSGTAQAATDLGMDVLQGNPPRPLKSAVVGAIGGGIQGAMEKAGQGLASASRVSKYSRDEALRRSTAGRVGLMFGAPPEEAHVRLAEEALVSTGKALGRAELSPGRVAAEQKIQTFANREVDMMPVKQHILSMRRSKSVTGERQQLNAYLDDLAKRVPDKMPLEDFDQFIREMREPVRAQLGNLESRVPAQAQKSVASFATGYRNSTVLPEAAKDYASASKYLTDIKDLRRRLATPKGTLRDGAENLWRKSLRTVRIREAIQKYDAQTGDNLAPRALELAMKDDWSNDDGKTAIGILEAAAGWLGRASVFLGRVGGKTAIAAARPSGAVTGAATSAFESMMRTPPNIRNPENP